jgi:hypothetical protein
VLLVPFNHSLQRREVAMEYTETRTLRDRFESGVFGIQGMRYETALGVYRFDLKDGGLNVSFEPSKSDSVFGPCVVPLTDSQLKIDELSFAFKFFVKQQSLWAIFKHGLKMVRHLNVYRKWDPIEKRYESVHYRNRILGLDYVITQYKSGFTYLGHIKKAVKSRMDFSGNWRLDDCYPLSIKDSSEHDGGLLDRLIGEDS